MTRITQTKRGNGSPRITHGYWSSGTKTPGSFHHEDHKEHKGECLSFFFVSLVSFVVSLPKSLP